LIIPNIYDATVNFFSEVDPVVFVPREREREREEGKGGSARV
jgi:hypothetical protein